VCVLIRATTVDRFRDGMQIMERVLAGFCVVTGSDLHVA